MTSSNQRPWRGSRAACLPCSELDVLQYAFDAFGPHASRHQTDIQLGDLELCFFGLGLALALVSGFDDLDSGLEASPAEFLDSLLGLPSVLEDESALDESALGALVVSPSDVL
ncbi:MAG: hypothetical protein AAF355_10285 [Myxococcota bacterium]